MKIYPLILSYAEANELPLGGFRVGFLAKDWDRGKAGIIPFKEFKHYLKGLGLAKSTYSRWIREAFNLGLFQRVSKELVKLASWGDFGFIAGCPAIERPAEIEIDKFINAGWLSFGWAGFLTNHEGVIARATLERLSGGVPRRTQIYREHRAGVENQANYAGHGKVKDDPDKAIGLSGEPGHYTKAGEIRRQLPNSRTVPECVQQANKGRLKKINRTLAALCSDKAFRNVRAFRLYSDDYKQTKSIKRTDRKSDDRNRPDVIYERIEQRTAYKTGKQIGVYCAINL